MSIKQQLLAFIAPTVGPWTQNPAYGQRFQGRLPVEGDEIYLTSNDAVPGPPQPVAVNLFRSDRNAGLGVLDNADVRAVVTYGAGGVNNTFLCDWVSGAQFALVANSVRVSARTYRPIPQEAYSVPAGSVVLGCTFGVSGSAPTLPLTLTETVRLVSDEPQTLRIPDFARGATFYYDDGSPTATWFARFQASSGLMTFPGTRWAESWKSGGFPIPGGANQLILFQDSGATRNVTVVWSLGI